jgi:transposase
MLTTLSTEDLIPVDHPIRRIRVIVDAVLAELDDVFDQMYASSGRSSVPPESLLKATILMAMYSIRSERAFCERLNYDLLFKWFLDLRIDQPPSTRRRSPRTANASSTPRSPMSSSPLSCARRNCAATCRRITSPSTARC